ncbi:hypothetical protein D3C71_706050 [compost metagenome]
MKKSYFILLLILGSGFLSYAGISRKSIADFYIFSTVKNTQIKAGKARINLHFHSLNFRDIPKDVETIIYFSVNNVTDTLFLDSTFAHTIELKSGKTQFKFWAGPGYNEVISDSVEIGNQTENEAQITFNSDYMLIEVDKPVIYFQSPVQLDFNLKLNPAGDLSFTYPKYENQWKGTVYPTGEIEINQQKYPYLFWDSRQQFQLKKHTNGYHIHKNDVVAFLEKHLSDLGFSFSEKADFITYWGPKMTQYESLFVQFYQQESCNQFATLHCNPQPEQINRFYIAFSEWNDSFEPYLNPIEQTPFIRTGFTILEWGGFEIKSSAL